ncbi:MAG: hypothetical protein HY434_02450 [Candidatus Liptonbacteria bacterium]|nr:hypothetical protein [Candidatus Liptonbacteria bacterium]
MVEEFQKIDLGLKAMSDPPRLAVFGEAGDDSDALEEDDDVDEDPDDEDDSDSGEEEAGLE